MLSAHYPPNFVSGGTLVPQRTSRDLRRLGLDVRVFAGWLGAERPPLEEWDEVDETGLPVHWIATTPWTGWADRHNFDNPAVTERFAAWCEVVAPDVVHAHSLQSVGAGPLRAAQAMGVPTVVTMHDFWWWCARQFLCTRDFQPCSPVVAAGTCPCEVDRPWLDERNAVLAPVLAACQRVIAVSESTRRVAVANGVDPSRVVVIENGVVAAPPSSARTPTPAVGGGAVRLTFAGGANPMKGVQVLARAVAALHTSRPWTLACYGCQEVSGLFPQPQVTTLPSFAPDRLDEVLGATDVLVLPSVMRESYSLLAREALARGVPVITSDSLGPEEVVVDGRNGLVVPSADHDALAAAMSRVVEEPHLLERLRAGTATVALPAPEEQATAYRDLYGALLAPAPAAAAHHRRRSIRRVLFVVGIEGAPLRYRARLPAEALALLGVDSDVCHYRDPSVAGLSARADIVVVYRVPATVQVLHLIAGVQRRGVPVVFDVDDLIFDPQIAPEIPALSLLPAEEAALWLEGVRRYRLTMEQCDAYIGSTEMLVRHAERSVGIPGRRWPNGVGLLLARGSDDALRAPRSPGPLRIGYLSGTNTHDNDWRYIEPAIVRLLDEHPDVEVWLVGLIQPSDRLARHADRIHHRGLVHWTELPGILRDLDVNLAPMEPGSRFNEAKSAIKWLEAALTATPTVASPTGPFSEAISDGVTGVLAGDGTAWLERTAALLADPGARARIGAAARREALLRFSPAVQGRRYLDILEQVVRRDHPDAEVASELAHDEPATPISLEGYGPAGPIEAAADVEAQRRVSVAPAPPTSHWRVLAAGLAGTYREGGPPALARLVLDAARRRSPLRR